MKIAIVGTRGIPNHYGGFEQCAEFLALGLVNSGHDVIVYNSHNHPYQEKNWNGVVIVHCYDPEDKIGTAGQFIYDLNCILDVRKRNVDIVLQLGYTSSSVWGWLMPKHAVITTNMDGLEWKRTKYSNTVRSFLLWAEKLGVNYSDYLISDSVGIQEYLSLKYNVESDFIPYGADVFKNPSAQVLDEFNLDLYNYDLLIARLEPENSIEIILEGVNMANHNRPFLVIGKNETPYGKYLKSKFERNANIRFVGGIYNIEKLNNLRYYSNIYFHGHTVGGTNPSLLEAMASSSLICANSNPFNKYILGEDALYFNTATEVCEILDSVNKKEHKNISMLNANLEKIDKMYNWETIVGQYLNHFNNIIHLGKRK
ncbi:MULTISPECIES: DUF1972 domain-containing protein [Sphingobacterium]|uniref:DUF1972 domain-containing protein n=1 Tax=Sphingobacterium TaxID=28453 RepID=UPI00257E6551|nr:MULTISPECIES: DUF1972 domain-containing protein [Sphingobacterium]